MANLQETREPIDELSFIMEVKEVFFMKDRGYVATGLVALGRVKRSDTLEVLSAWLEDE